MWRIWRHTCIPKICKCTSYTEIFEKFLMILWCNNIWGRLKMPWHGRRAHRFTVELAHPRHCELYRRDQSKKTNTCTAVYGCVSVTAEQAATTLDTSNQVRTSWIKIRTSLRVMVEEKSWRANVSENFQSCPGRWSHAAVSQFFGSDHTRARNHYGTAEVTVINYWVFVHAIDHSIASEIWVNYIKLSYLRHTLWVSTTFLIFC
jgi:hypothetical protein